MSATHILPNNKTFFHLVENAVAAAELGLKKKCRRSLPSDFAEHAGATDRHHLRHYQQALVSNSEARSLVSAWLQFFGDASIR